MNRKYATHCDGPGFDGIGCQARGARFRTLLNQHLCDWCYADALAQGHQVDRSEDEHRPIEEEW